MNDAMQDSGGGGGFQEALAARSRDVRHWATRRILEQGDFNVQLGADDSRSWAGYQVLTVERYLSGQRPTMGDPNTDDPPNNNYYVPFEGEVWNHVFAELVWVDELIMSFGQSKPSTLASLIGSVQGAPDYLMADVNWRTSVRGALVSHQFDSGGTTTGDAEMRESILLDTAIALLTQWNGSTAQAYDETFVGASQRWKEVVLNNFILAEILVGSAEAQLAVYAACRERVIGVCDKTIDALWHISDGDDGGPNASTLVSIVGAVAVLALTVAALPATAVALPAAAAFVGAAFAIGAPIITELESSSGSINTQGPQAPTDVTGANAHELLESMKNHLEGVKTSAPAEEEKIRAALSEAYNAVVSSAEARSKFEIIFKDGTSMNDMGEPRVELDEADVRKAATELFPQSAARMFAAHELLAASGGDDGTAFTCEWSSEPTSVHAAWIALRDVLQDLTAANGDKVRFAGEFLLDYAVEIGAVDEAAAADERAQYDGLDIELSGR